MNEFIHLNQDQLIKALDGELTTAERIDVDLHLANCEQCLERYEAFSAVSEMLSRAVEAVPAAAPAGSRERLSELLHSSGYSLPLQSFSRRPVWAWAAAACVALLLLFAAYRAVTRRPVVARTPVTAALPEPASASSFIRLPYSDPALPLEAADVMRVQMRVSTLANAGIIRLPPNSSDGWVQADVLLGMDGEPYGIRLISSQSTQ